MGDTENSPLLKPPTVHPPVSPNCYEKSRYSSSWSSAIKLLLLSTIVLVCTATLVQLNMRGGGDHHHSLSNSPSADSPDGFFRCVSDPDTLIPLSAVNDDYCDCEEDGSDEWATSACNKGRFVCEAKRGGQAWIPSYKVHDKFCDCVDGSDEAPGVCEVEVEMMTEELEVQQL